MSNNVQKIKKVVRATNYLTAAQIYLKDNFILKEKLKFDHIKPRLLGHWGTCPGINFIYAHLNNFIKENKVDMLFLLGPGHGFPALQSNVFLDGTLGKYYKEATQDKNGIEYVVKNFSWPYGFPSHASPVTPGVILEGGELGYSLSTAYGSILDNPDLIATCVIGDGEAETAALATSWHLSKLINPAKDGTVLPILHLNGYKISAPTFFGRMSDCELMELFEGYGYEVFIIDAINAGVSKKEDIAHEEMIKTLNKCYKSIKKIQNNARLMANGQKRSLLGSGLVRSGGSETFPRFPMIILRTLKGWTGIQEMEGQKYEGNYLSHQVVGKDAKTNEIELRAIETWLKSYKFNELFNEEKGFDKDILDIIPEDGFRMSDNKNAHAYTGILGEKNKPLNLSKPTGFMFDIDDDARGAIKESSMISMGKYLADVFEKNEENKNFRLMSPDETYSNKLDEVFKSTKRAWGGLIKKTDKDMGRDGRVMEMLSEHALHGMLQGYILTGRNGILASYEAFMQIVASMADQYSKFLKIAKDIEWRNDLSSMNYVLTSSLWRQEHNGFSHQNPGFIDTLLQKHNNFVHVYFPADANLTLAYTHKMLESKNNINVIVAEKNNEEIWLNEEESLEQIKTGVMEWGFASEENPDIVLVASGQYATKEVLAAIKIVKTETPKIKIRFVGVTELSPYTLGNYSEKMPMTDFKKFFTEDRPVIFNFHGYPETLKQILFDYENDYRRFSVHGYLDSGSTTTPFDLLLRNKVSRYDIAIDVWNKILESTSGGVPEGAGATQSGSASSSSMRGGTSDRPLDSMLTEMLIKKYNQKIEDAKKYARDNGVDAPEINDWKWSGGNLSPKGVR